MSKSSVDFPSSVTKTCNSLSKARELIVKSFLPDIKFCPSRIFYRLFENWPKLDQMSTPRLEGKPRVSCYNKKLI